MRVLAEETWAWMLYSDDTRHFVSVVCGTVAVYTIDLELTADEVAAFLREGAPFISRLALIVSSRPNEYRARHIARFDSIPGVSDATKAWRRAHRGCVSETTTSTVEVSELTSEIEALLHGAGLPTSDIRDARALDLFVVRDAGDAVGVIGLESYGVEGLLRSLVVVPSHRGLGLARALVAHVESIALERGMTRLYLLTNTASDFFMRCGYEVAQRTDAPLAIASTKQFAGLCPSSATFMRKALR